MEKSINNRFSCRTISFGGGQHEAAIARREYGKRWTSQTLRAILPNKVRIICDRNPRTSGQGMRMQPTRNRKNLALLRERASDATLTLSNSVQGPPWLRYNMEFRALYVLRSSGSFCKRRRAFGWSIGFGGPEACRVELVVRCLAWKCRA